jgi:hypothetical protein
MKSRATTRFWFLYERLPAGIQKLAAKNYDLWRGNPRHPSLRFKKLHGRGERFSVRVGDNYRAIGRFVEDGVEWVWIGSHDEYDELLRLL